mgnify:CR=1 FL=1
MDRFTKYVLVIMVVGVLGMIIATYVGVFVYGGNMETKYVSVIEEHAEQLGIEYHHLIELGEEGEYVAFTIAGAVAGFIIGYLLPSLSKEGEAKTSKKGVERGG